MFKFVWPCLAMILSTLMILLTSASAFFFQNLHITRSTSTMSRCMSMLNREVIDAMGKAITEKTGRFISFVSSSSCAYARLTCFSSHVVFFVIVLLLNKLTSVHHRMKEVTFTYLTLFNLLYEIPLHLI